MKVVIDSNRIIAALIKEHTTRSILFNNKFQFCAPSFIKSEVYKYKKHIMKKAELDELEFALLIELIFDKITIVSYKEYQNFLEYFTNKVNDVKDIPYLAACKFCKAEGIWTHDPHFKRQKEIKIFTNINMLAFIKEE